jgi:hypothetical protein
MNFGATFLFPFFRPPFFFWLYKVFYEWFWEGLKVFRNERTDGQLQGVGEQEFALLRIDFNNGLSSEKLKFVESRKLILTRGYR